MVLERMFLKYFKLSLIITNYFHHFFAEDKLTLFIPYLVMWNMKKKLLILVILWEKCGFLAFQSCQKHNISQKPYYISRCGKLFLMFNI